MYTTPSGMAGGDRELPGADLQLWIDVGAGYTFVRIRSASRHPAYVSSIFCGDGCGYEIAYCHRSCFFVYDRQYFCFLDIPYRVIVFFVSLPFCSMRYFASSSTFLDWSAICSYVHHALTYLPPIVRYQGWQSVS